MTDLFENYGTQSAGMLHVSPAEAVELCRKGAILVDVREDYLSAFKKFDVPNIMYVPAQTTRKEIKRKPK